MPLWHDAPRWAKAGEARVIANVASAAAANILNVGLCIGFHGTF